MGDQNWQGGTSFGSQNWSGRTDLGGGPIFSLHAICMFIAVSQGTTVKQHLVAELLSLSNIINQSINPLPGAENEAGPRKKSASDSVSTERCLEEGHGLSTFIKGQRKGPDIEIMNLAKAGLGLRELTSSSVTMGRRRILCTDVHHVIVEAFKQLEKTQVAIYYYDLPATRRHYWKLNHQNLE